MKKTKNNIRNSVFYLIGLLFMACNKVRYSLAGYRTPRPFKTTDFERAIEYDFNVVNGWIKHIQKFTKGEFDISGKNVLELGPGADLGVGLILLAMGAKKYNAVDVNLLVKGVPAQLYEHLLVEIKKRIPESNINFLRQQLKHFYNGSETQLNYIYDKSFSFSSLKNEEIDVVFSQAAFEHFDDIEDTFKQVTEKVVVGGSLLSIIDFQTHTRWLREKDPLNIYRYPAEIYKLLTFRGSPNRIRPEKYKRCLEYCGWKNVLFFPSCSLRKDQLDMTQPHLLEPFKANDDMAVLSGVLFAKKG